MRRRAAKLAGNERRVMTSMATRSQAVRDRLSRHRPIADEERVLGVGSGATGLLSCQQHGHEYPASHAQIYPPEFVRDGGPSHASSLACDCRAREFKRMVKERH
jgi:hypothetical protein